jgi:hypothetical protein
MNRTITTSIAVFTLLATASCSRHEPPPPKKDAARELPTFATILVDYSASFAPLEQNDRLALKELGNALSILAVQEWSPPTTIVWRRIGSTSTVPPPLCEVMEYKQSIIGAASSGERLRTQLDTCAETVVKNSRAEKAAEPFTDIGSAIMMAAQNWASLQGTKAIIILSDMKEDLPINTNPTTINLNGETVLLVHRPGTTESQDPTAYLERIENWQERLRAAGAKNVRALPTFRATNYAMQEALTQQPETGTSISLINDLTTDTKDEPTIERAVTAIAGALAKSAANNAEAYPAPVAAGWFRTSTPAWRMTAIAPAVYKPRLVHHKDEINTVEDFTTAIEELGIATAQRQSTSNTNLDETLALITSTDTTTNRRLVVLSDFLNPPPTNTRTSLKTEHVLLIYRSSRATNSATFFERLKDWQEYFRRSGTEGVCALDINTLTPSTITSCLQ